MRFFVGYFLTVSEIFDDECDAMDGMTLNVHYANRFLIYDFPRLSIVTFALGRTV